MRGEIEIFPVQRSLYGERSSEFFQFPKPIWGGEA